MQPKSASSAKMFAIFWCVLVGLCALCLCVPIVDGASACTWTLGLVGLGMAYAVQDASFSVTKALPSAAATVASDGIDLGHGSRGDHLANCELQISAPALTVSQLANGSTMKYAVYHDTAVGFGSETLLYGDVIVQTGAAGAGAAAATASVRLPVDVKRYVRVKATNSAAADASAASLTAKLLF